MPVLRTSRWRCGMSDFKLGLESATPHHQRRPLSRSVASTKGQKPLAFGEKPIFKNQIIRKRKHKDTRISS